MTTFGVPVALQDFPFLITVPFIARTVNWGLLDLSHLSSNLLGTKTLFTINHWCYIVLDLWNNCRDSTESSHIPHIQFPLLWTSSISLVHLSQLMSQSWYIVIKVHIYSHFFSFCLMFCSVPGSHPGYHVILSCHVSLSSSGLWWFLRLFLFFHDLDRRSIS